eukprot:s3509_g4.t1
MRADATDQIEETPVEEQVAESEGEAAVEEDDEEAYWRELMEEDAKINLLMEAYYRGGVEVIDLFSRRRAWHIPVVDGKSPPRPSIVCVRRRRGDRSVFAASCVAHPRRGWQISVDVRVLARRYGYRPGGVLPLSLRVLRLGDGFDQPLVGIDWQPKLEELVFGAYFTQDLRNAVLPQELRRLEFGASFCLLQHQIVWPPYLDELRIRQLPPQGQRMHAVALPNTNDLKFADMDPIGKTLMLLGLNPNDGCSQDLFERFEAMQECANDPSPEPVDVPETLVAPAEPLNDDVHVENQMITVGDEEMAIASQRDFDMATSMPDGSVPTPGESAAGAVFDVPLRRLRGRLSYTIGNPSGAKVEVLLKGRAFRIVKIGVHDKQGDLT